jgi:hypothetical protein
MVGTDPFPVNLALTQQTPSLVWQVCWSRLPSHGTAALLEETAQQVATFLAQNIPLTFETMIEALVRGQQVEDAAAGATLGVAGAVHDAGDAGMNKCAGAHGAGFEGDVEGGGGEAIVAEALAGGAEGADLSVGAGVMGSDGAVPALAQDLVRGDQHGPDRDLAQWAPARSARARAWRIQWLSSSAVDSQGSGMAWRWNLALTPTRWFPGAYP